MPRPNVLVGTTLWRVFVASVAWYGFDQVTRVSRYFPWSELPNWRGLGELSQLASLLTALGYLALAAYPLFVGGRRHEPRRSWLRGALAVLLWLVGLTAIVIFDNHGQLDRPGFLFEHLITPLIVTIDLIFVGRGLAAVRWWYPLTWVLPPLVYFGGLAASGFAAYSDLFDPDQPSLLAMVVAGFFGGILAIGYAFYGIGKLKGALTRGRDASTLTPVGAEPA